ncbi:Uncharacterised protein [Mycobacteroides abscessus subsp. massiliense]|nr:Uncharacterised protein [Mycobacteroides abscessus subsp. massiliense]
MAGCFITFDPHHLGARHHHLTCGSVAELEHRLDHPALLVGHHTTLLRHVHDLTQLDFGGKWTIAKSTSGCHRVAEQNQQPRDGAE